MNNLADLEKKINLSNPERKKIREAIENKDSSLITKKKYIFNEVWQKYCH